MARFDPADAPALLRAARLDAALTQTALAERAGISQPNLAAIESGRRTASPELLERLLRAADYRPSTALLRVRDEVLAEMIDYGVSGVSVFGSAARGEDHFDSDLDLILDADRADALRALAFIPRIEELAGFPVDGHLRYSAEASDFGRRMLAEAVAL
jgi:uncharacterized protein